MRIALRTLSGEAAESTNFQTTVITMKNKNSEEKVKNYLRLTEGNKDGSDIKGTPKKYIQERIERGEKKLEIDLDKDDT